jgi:hypothetical protein
MAANIDAYQLMTLLFGAAIIVTAIVNYNNPTLEGHIQQFIQALSLGLGFFFAGYALILTGVREKKTANMYKWIIIVITLAAWIDVVWTGISQTSGWYNIQQEVALPLAQGSLIALPIALISFA